MQVEHWEEKTLQETLGREDIAGNLITLRQINVLRLRICSDERRNDIASFKR